MAKTNSIVVRLMENGKAEVVAEQKGSCGSCSSAHSCHTSKSAMKVKTTVINPVGAGPGDMVAIDISTSKLLKSMALVYLFPVMGLVTGAVIGSNMAGSLSMSETAGAVLFGGICLAIGFVSVIFFSKVMASKDAYTPVITRIIKRGSVEPVIIGHIKPVPEACPSTIN
jgi:sigma-E factor negative regulatory protein RseC